jgi:ribonuclease G
MALTTSVKTSTKKEIFINAALNEIRVAITENGRLAEIFWELPEKERHIGNIYLGRVQRIMQGMNAAFVEIGLRQSAFLHFSDVGELDEAVGGDDEDNDDDDDDDDDTNDEETKVEEKIELSEAAAIALRKKIISPTDSRLPTFLTKRAGNVKINLEEGQAVLVQVTREAYGSKGLRVTTKISFPGRYLVLLPFSPSIGVSKKIWNIKERKRLRGMAKSILPEGVGCIVRTEAQSHDDETFKRDLQDLVNKWKAVQEKVIAAGEDPEPQAVHRDMTMAQSLIRDLLTADVQHVTLDSRKLYNDIRAYTEWASPAFADRIRYYNGTEPIFAAFGLVEEIRRSQSRLVSLPSGGYLVFDHTEAMTVVDVNSGRYAPNRDQELNAMRTNLEAVREIARQIRLRDIGGMIIVDCIDVQEEANRRRIVEAMFAEIKSDRTQVVVYPLTQLGLMQITRQRVRQNIQQVITETCPTCHGHGTVRSRAAVISSIERWLRNFTKQQEPPPMQSTSHPKGRSRGGRNQKDTRSNKDIRQAAAHITTLTRAAEPREFKLVLRVHPHLAASLHEGAVSKLARLMFKFFVRITLEQDETLSVDEYRFFSVRRQRDITDEYW